MHMGDWTLFLMVAGVLFWAGALPTFVYGQTLACVLCLVAIVAVLALGVQVAGNGW